MDINKPFPRYGHLSIVANVGGFHSGNTRRNEQANELEGSVKSLEILEVSNWQLLKNGSFPLS
jgi:hypothetical protein